MERSRATPPPAAGLAATPGRAAGLLAASVLVATAGLLGGCSEASAGPAGPPEPIYHDFGTLELGTSKTEDFDIPVPTGADRVIVESFHGHCDCAVGMLMLHNPGESSPTPVYGLSQDHRVVQPGGEVTLRLTLRTDRKEAVDLPRTPSRAWVVFKLINGRFQRFESRFIDFHYAIRTPIKVSPVSHIDFGELPMSSPAIEHVLELSSNIPGQEITYGEAYASPECITAVLEEEAAGKHVLRVRITPFTSQRTAPQIRGLVTVATGLEHYPVLKIPVSGKFIGDIQFEPSYHISFNIFPFEKPREGFVNIVDHNRSRPKGLVFLRWEDDQGQDVTEEFGKHFAVEFEDLSGRKTRVRVKYLGTLGGLKMRGWLLLGKQKGGEPVARLRIIGHNSNS